MSKAKFIVNIITFAFFAGFVYVSRQDILEAWKHLEELNIWFFLLQIPCQALFLLNVAHLYYSYFKNLALLGSFKLKDSCKVALELNFINNVFPSGGVVGFSYLSLRLQPFGIKAASSTLAQIMRFGLTFLSFLILLGLGLLILAIDGSANDLVMLIGGSVFFMIIFGTLVFVFLISDRQRIKRFVAWLPKGVNKLVGLIHYKSKKPLLDIPKIERVLSEIHDNYALLSKDYKVLKSPFFYALAANFFDILTIYCVYLAFGATVNPGAVILAYSIANFAGLVAILPGGFGVYEPLMVVVSKAAGIKDSGLALATTLIYRMLKILVFIPIGYIFYHDALNRLKIFNSKT